MDIYKKDMGKGKNIAYIRVSTVEQNEARQKAALQKYCIDRWFIEKASGKDLNRPKLQEMLEYISEEQIQGIETKVTNASKMLISLRKAIENKITN